MDERLDSGKILAVKQFPIDKSDNLPSRLDKSYKHAVRLTKFFLCEQEFPDGIEISSEWGQSCGTRNHLKSVSVVSPGDSAELIERKIRAFNSPRYPIVVPMRHG